MYTYFIFLYFFDLQLFHPRGITLPRGQACQDPLSPHRWPAKGKATSAFCSRCPVRVWLNMGGWKWRRGRRRRIDGIFKSGWEWERILSQQFCWFRFWWTWEETWGSPEDHINKTSFGFPSSSAIIAIIGFGEIGEEEAIWSHDPGNQGDGREASERAPRL